MIHHTNWPAKLPKADRRSVCKKKGVGDDDIEKSYNIEESNIQERAENKIDMKL